MGTMGMGIRRGLGELGPFLFVLAPCEISQTFGDSTPGNFLGNSRGIPSLRFRSRLLNYGLCDSDTLSNKNRSIQI